MKKNYIRAYLHSFLFVNLLICLLVGCKSEPTKPPEPVSLLKLSLIVLDVSCTEAWVKVKADSFSLPYSFFLKINNQDSLNYTLSQRDTILYINNLLPARNYSFIGSINQNNKLYISEKTDTTTLDTTSHNYTWQKIVIGDFQSTLYDVWGTDENNIYAAGTLRLDGKDVGTLKWNGIEWKPQDSLGAFSIFGFSNIDIWEAGGGILYFNGSIWYDISASDTELNSNRPYYSLWGTCSSNLFFASNKGKIMFWDGSKTSIAFLRDGISFKDIRGTASDNIWAVGLNVSNTSLITRYDGNNWNIQLNFPPDGLAISVLPLNMNTAIIGGNYVYLSRFGYWNDMRYPLNYRVRKIRGSSINNLFAVGDFGTIAHYNGMTWHWYNELFTPSGGGNKSVFITGNKVFIVGLNEDGISAKIIIGTKQ